MVNSDSKPAAVSPVIAVTDDSTDSSASNSIVSTADHTQSPDPKSDEISINGPQISTNPSSSPEITPKTSTDTTNVPLPPIKLPSAAQTSHLPSALGAVKADIQDTTEKDSSFATALASKVNGVDPLTLRPPAPTTLSDQKPPKSDKKTADTKPSKSAGSSSKRKMMMVTGLAVLLILVGGTIGGYYLQQQQQDTRRDAASEEVTGTEISRTPSEWQTFNQGWKTLIADSNNGWKEYVTFAQNEGARYRCQAPIMKVADETLYGCDLNALFVISDLETYIQPQSLPPQSTNLNAVLDLLITDSALLQEAGKQGDVYLTSTIYNNPEKDTFQRYTELRKVRQLFEGKYEKTVDFEALVIYFHNQTPPAIGVEKAQAAAKAKMDTIYARLQSGALTFEQAGAEIKADKITGDTSGVSMAQLDPVYKDNAYLNIKGQKFFAHIFRDDVYDDELRSLGEGQMSTVRLCKDYAFTNQELVDAEKTGAPFNPPMVDSCYIIFKVNKIHLGLLGENATESAETQVSQEYKASAESLLK